MRAAFAREYRTGTAMWLWAVAARAALTAAFDVDLRARLGRLDRRRAAAVEDGQGS